MEKLTIQNLIALSVLDTNFFSNIAFEIADKHPKLSYCVDEKS